MNGLNKVNRDWIPLQTKVFSRWVSNQLKDFLNISVNDIQKDLSNGVALVELATVLTHKKVTRQWCQMPKLKVEMVQNCDLAIDMFSKDGVNFVGISGKDISDNNQKLILGLIWTLILHYSVNQSMDTGKNEKKRAQNNKDNKRYQRNSQSELISWANQRIENYPNVHNFTPYDLSLCALLDSYLPNKINFYSLDPSDNDHNAELAIKTMEEIGIPIYVYPEELKKTDDSVDEKTLLTQLASAKVILDSINVKESKCNQKTENNSLEEIAKLNERIARLELELQVQNDACEIAENEASRVRLEMTHLKIELEEEKVARMKAENDRESEQIENEDAQSMIEQLTQSLTKLQHKYEIIFSEIIENNSEVQRLRCAWDMSQIELENEREARQEAEFELENLRRELNGRTEKVIQAENEYRIQSFMTTLNEVKNDINHKVDFIEQSIEKVQNKINSLKFKKGSENNSKETDQKSEIERLRCAWDIAQNDLENELSIAQDFQFQLENVKHSISHKLGTLLKAESECRFQSFTASFGEIKRQLNMKLNEMETKLQNANEKLNEMKCYVKKVNSENVKLLMEQVEMADRMAEIDRKYKATIGAYSDAVQAALKEAREQQEEREKAEITIDHLMDSLKRHMH